MEQFRPTHILFLPRCIYRTLNIAMPIAFKPYSSIRTQKTSLFTTRVQLSNASPTKKTDNEKEQLAVEETMLQTTINVLKTYSSNIIQNRLKRLCHPTLWNFLPILWEERLHVAMLMKCSSMAIILFHPPIGMKAVTQKYNPISH